MKHLIYKHTDAEGNTCTIHKSGRTWLSCLGQIDDALARYGAKDVYVDVNRILTNLHVGKPYTDSDDGFTLTPTDIPAKVEPDPIRSALNRLLDSPDLNLDSLEAETRDAIDAAQDALGEKM